MNLERYLFEQGFKPDTYRTRILAICISLIINPTENDISLKKEVALILDTTENNVSQHLYWIKKTYVKHHGSELENRTPLEVVYKLAYDYKDYYMDK